MKNKIVIYMLLIVLGVFIGSIGYAIMGNLKYKDDSAINPDSERTLYSCGMHPNIIQEEAGTCPICGMNLTPIKNSNTSSKRKILYWRAPMDPNEIYDKPGKSKMGMDLIPVYEDDTGSSGIVKIDGTVQQNMNVKLATVEEKVLSSKIVTNGVLSIDERNEYIVTTKVNGWVEKLYINFTGQVILKGQKLIDIYSPELVAAQQELLTAIDYQNSINITEDSISNSRTNFVKNAIQKLEYLDVTEEDINSLIKTREIKKYMTLYAQTNGTVLMKNVIEGEKIVEGKQLLHIADLSNLWLIADVYENELSKVDIGSKVLIKFNFLPTKIYSGKISFIYPTIDSKTRVVKLRINIPNPTGELKPDMYATVELTGNKLDLTPIISETSVIRSGEKNIVILSLGEGRFKPTEIELGSYSGGYYQVLKGLKVNDKIVSSAQFMIDSESKLRTAVNMFSSENNDEKSESTDKINEQKIESAVHDHSSSIIHEGIIDVEKIDKNNDGKLFQDPMDWNVISDKEGRCPLCNMFLKEVTIDEAKNNLKENGFEFK